MATYFYKNLFLFEPKPDIHLRHGFWDDSDLVLEEENNLLDKPFFENQIKETIMSSYANGVPGPNGFSFLFYQTYWELIKSHLMWFIRDFEAGSLNVYRLNFATITMIPKEPNAIDMNKFRPISLSNYVVKIFTKAMTTGVSPICYRLSPNQTAFIKGRFILQSVVMAHEVIHEIHRAGTSGLILKLDYEKAYDRVTWEFHVKMLTSRGFGSKRTGWICSTLFESSFYVRINDTNGPYFVGGKGLNQGDSLSPFPFILVLDVFLRCSLKLFITI